MFSVSRRGKKNFTSVKFVVSIIMEIIFREIFFVGFKRGVILKQENILGRWFLQLFTKLLMISLLINYRFKNNFISPDWAVYAQAS